MKVKTSSFTVLCLFFCITVVGISLIPSLNLRLKPNRASQRLVVNFQWKNTSAKIIEQEVTSKLEGLFNSLKGIQEITSRSRKGSGSIQITLKEKTDADLTRFEVLNLIRQNYQKLPEEVSYPQLSKNRNQENESPILTYTVNANVNTQIIKKYVEEQINPQLSSVEGIERISLYGATPYEWVITYQSDELQYYSLNVSEVMDALEEYLTKEELGKGIVQSNTNLNEKEMPVQLTYHSMEKFSWQNIPIKKLGDRVLFLTDIATVELKKGKIRDYFRINGLNTLNLAIYADDGTNIIQVSKNVQNVMQKVEANVRSGYFLTKIQDASEYLITELTKIEKRALFSVLILLVLSILIYRQYRYLLVLFSSIVVNLFIAVIFYRLFDVQLQLYSLAGITISFGIIIDNCIVMMDHVLLKKNKKAFLAILAATCTTIAAVLIIFLLEADQRLNLLDFAIVIGINIGVSLFVSFYFVPAVLEQLKFQKIKKTVSRKRRRRILYFSRKYQNSVVYFQRHTIKWLLVLLFIWSFGIPFHLLPEKIENPNLLGTVFNYTLGSDFFVSNLRPSLEKYAGGAFRLFSEEVFEESYYVEPEQTSIKIQGRMPEGCTIEQLNEAIVKIESFLAGFPEISQFETRISSYRNSQILVYFQEEFRETNFPLTLKTQIESKVLSLGGVDWFVSGVGEGFSNASSSDVFGNRLTLEGYNYDALYSYAESLKERLIRQSNQRIGNIEISGDIWQNTALYEYFLDFKLESIGLSNVNTKDLYSSLKNKLHEVKVTSIVRENELQPVRLVSDEYLNFTKWDLKNTPIQMKDKFYKLDQLASVDKRKTGNIIQKRNQQYSLTVAFQFNGPDPMAKGFADNISSEFQKTLPLGYRVYNSHDLSWDKEDDEQYYYLLYIITIIFFVCSILLNSLRQPFAIIMMIPISFVGVFLTFYLFDINFDQGGYAAFILIAGISVNSALYILNDFNNLKKERPSLPRISQYQKAFLSKVTPVLITILTTIFGLTPFIWDGQQEVFWFSFAAGSIGGLIFSLIGIFVYLPLFMNLRMKKAS
jgi:multidrug efflux pump subunit AcrB